MRSVLVALIVVVLWAAGPPVRAADSLNGSYFGVDDADGASILIEPDSGGFQGVFYDRLGNSQRFEADRMDEIAEGILDMDGRTVLLRMAPLPYGAEVAIIPFDGNGQLILEASRMLNFVRQGVNLPDLPAEYREAPRTPGERVAANSFLASYQFWEPVGVVNGYLGLPERFLPLVRMFPAVQLDIIWKLCLAPSADQALALALRGQGVDCPGVLEAIASTQRNGRFKDYKAEVERDRETLRMVVRCADGYLQTKDECDQASEQLSQAAVSLRTAAGVLADYQ
ncbi:MAG: hypothetical protein AAFP68_09540 [Pseudomonadota bacterium]